MDSRAIVVVGRSDVSASARRDARDDDGDDDGDDDDGGDDDDDGVDASSRPRASAGERRTTTTTTGRAATRQLGRGLNSSGTRETRGGVGPRRATGERVRTRGGMARVTYFCSRGDGRERRGDRARGRRRRRRRTRTASRSALQRWGAWRKDSQSTMTVARR